MIIRKEDAFLTDKDRAEIAAAELAMRNLLGQIKEAGQVSWRSDKEEMQQALDESHKKIDLLWQEYNEQEEKIYVIRDKIEDIYYKSFAGKENAQELIEADAQEVVAAVSKEELKKYITFAKEKSQAAADAKKKLKELKEQGFTGDTSRLEAVARQSWHNGNSNYAIACGYFQVLLRVQFSAVVHCKVDNAGLVEIANNRAAKFYKKPAEKVKPQFDIIETSPDDELNSKYFNMPTSAVTQAMYQLLGSSSLEEMQARNKLINHNQKIEILQNRRNPSQRIITKETDKGSFSIGITDIEKIGGNNKAVKKMLALSLIKLNEQAVHNGTLTKEYITIPLQELADIGFYKNTKTARKGFKETTETLTSIKAAGETESGDSDLVVMFIKATVKNGVGYIFPNPYINWAGIANYFTIMPKYSFKLKSNAFDLINYISYIARQRTREIKEKGYFTISLRAVQNCLDLPNERENKNPERDIKKPIRDAVAEIMAADRKENFVISIVADNNASTSDYLDKGYLKIKPAGDYGEHFIKIAEKHQKQIETATKRKAAIVDAAKARNMAAKMENEGSL